MTRITFRSSLLASLVVALVAAILVPTLQEPASSDAACPPGFHQERESIRGITAKTQELRPQYQGGSEVELNRLREDGCVPQQRPEPFSELALRDAEQSAIRSAPFGELPVGAVRAGAMERQALLQSAPDVPGNDGEAKLYGKGPLNFDDPRYQDANGTGIIDSTGRIDEFEYDATTNRMFAAIGTGGVWLSEDRGAQWRPITDNLPTTVSSAVAYTPEGGPQGTVHVLTGEHTFGGSAYTGIGAFYSLDLGKTWTRASGVPDGALGFAIEVDPANPQRVYAATSKGLRRSTDGGRTYTDVVLPTGDCAGTYEPDKCNFANMVTDVVIQTPGGSTEVEGGTVVAAVGWRAGMKENEGRGVQSPNNGIYRSENGAPGSFERLDGLDGVAGGKERLGRIELGPARGEAQDHNYLYAIIEDAVLFNGGAQIEPLPDGGVTGANPTVFNGVYVSDDFGASWTQLADDQEMSDSCLLNQSVYCIPGLIEPGAQSWYNMWIEPDPTQQVGGVPSRLLLGLEEVWQSENNGLPQNTPATTFQVIGAYYGGADCLLVATNCNVNRNTGITTTHPDQHAGLILPVVDEEGAATGDAELFVGHDGGLSTQVASTPTIDDFDQNSWKLEQNNGLSTLLPYSAVWANDGVAYAGLQDNGHMRVNPDEDFAQYETYGADGTFAAVDPNNSDYAWESVQNGSMNVTTDGGVSWRAAETPDANVRFVNPFEMDPLDPNHLISGGKVIYETLAGPNTADGGEGNDWVAVFDLGAAPPAEGSNVGAPPNFGQSAVDVRGPGAYVGFCGVCDVLNTDFPFANGIATNVGTDVLPEPGTTKGWHTATARGLPNRFITGVAIDPQDPTLETIYVTLGGYSRRWAPPGTEGDENPDVGAGHVYKSTDAGENFVDISGNLPDVPALWVEPRGDQLMIGTDIGAYLSSDTEGGDYAPLGSDQLPATPVTSIQLKPNDPNRALLGLYGRGLWEYTFPADAPEVPTPPAPKPVKGDPPFELTPVARGEVLAGPFGFEADGEGWTVETNGNPSTEWTLQNQGHDSEQSWGVSPYSELADTTLVSPPFESKGGRVFLSWWTRYDIEGGGYDEYQLEWSQDGETWNTVTTLGGQNFGFPEWSREQALITTEPGEFFVRFPFYSDEICSSTGGPLCERTDGYEGAFVDDVLAQAGCGPYPDTKGNVHELSIKRVSDVGIACGFADGTYGPGRNITRGQMATMLANALDLPKAGDGDPTFSDIEGHAHAANIRAVAAAGIAQGFSDGRYKPNAPVSRGQMATFLATGFDLPRALDGGATFSDIAGNPHRGSIRSVASVNVARGYPNGTYRPGVAVERDQMATFMAKVTGLL